MPPVATNAPTTGLPATFYWGLLGFAAVLVALRYFLPSGKDRLQFRGSSENSAIGILQSQVASLQNELRGVKVELRRMSMNEDGNKEYRHALANQNQSLLAHNELMHSVLLDIVNESSGVPDYLKRRVAALRSPKEVLDSIPLPVIRQWSVEEVERIEKIERGEDH
jgi:hypothetical protein